MRLILKGILICLLILGIGSNHASLMAETSIYETTTTPSATEYFTPAMTSTVTVTPTLVYTDTVEPTITPTLAYTDTTEPTVTPTLVYTDTTEPTVTPTLVYTDTTEPTVTPTLVYTDTTEPTVTPTLVYTDTAEPTATPDPTATPMPTPEPYEDPTIYVHPMETILAVGDTYTFTVNIAPGESGVNGAQVHAKVDPAYLRILDMEAITAQLAVNEAPSFVDSTGIFSYSALLLSGTTINQDFEILQVVVEALAATEGTPIEFLTGEENFPPTDVTGPPEGRSVMDAAIDGLVIIEDSATMLGEVGLQGRPIGSSDSKVVPVTIELYPAGEITPTLTFSITLDQDGRFIKRNLEPGNYDVRLANNHTLFSKVNDVPLVAGNNDVYLRTLREGDIERDNVVKQDDLGIFGFAYNRCEGQEGFNALTDLNEDGCTETSDFGLLSGNFNTRGDVMYDFNKQEPLSTNLIAARIEMELDDLSSKEVGDSFDVTISVDPNGSKVNSATAHIIFDTTKLEATNVELLAVDMLDSVVQKPILEDGSVYFSKGTLGEIVTEKFELAKVTMKIKEENDGSSLAFTVDKFPHTSVVGTDGSVLAALSGAGSEELIFTGNKLYLPFISQ